MPTRAYASDAGYDLYAAERVVIDTEMVSIPTGIHVEPPSNVWFYLAARSSTRDKHRVHVWPAVIDPGYRGELYVKVSPILGRRRRVVEKGERLAQLVPHYTINLEWEQASELEGSDRGEGGFGSSGV